MLAKPLLVSATCLLLAGCIFFETPASRAVRKDPNFKAGYADGCASASAEGSDYRGRDRVRDEALYETSKPYRAGWAGGYANCNRKFTETPNPNVNTIPSVTP